MTRKTLTDRFDQLENMVLNQMSENIAQGKLIKQLMLQIRSDRGEDLVEAHRDVEKEYSELLTAHGYGKH